MHPVQYYTTYVSPFPFSQINLEPTVARLLSGGWFFDERKTEKYSILQKRYVVNQQHYRVVIRFRKNDDFAELDDSFPFVVFHCEAMQIQKTYGTEYRFRDLKSYHSKDYPSLKSYYDSGLPAELFSCLVSDLRETIVYLF